MADRRANSSLIDAADTEARYRTLFAALREPILMASVDGRIAGFNKAALSLFGGPARLYGRPVQELLPFIVPAEGEHQKTTWEGRLADTTGRTMVVEVSRTRLTESRLPDADVYVVHDVSRYAELTECTKSTISS